MRIRIGHLSTFYHTAILLMADETTGHRLGAEVEWRLLGTGPAIVDAFARGQLDLAYIGLPPAIIGIARGVGITCVAGGHMEGTVMVGKSDDRGFPEAHDLGEILGQFTGRKIGVPGKGSIHDVILADSLAKHHLSETIEVRNFAWADMVTEALASGEVAAACGTPALAVAARHYAGCRVLCPPSRLWPQNPSYGILARREFAHREKSLLKAFLSLHEEATRTLRTDPATSAEIISAYVGFIEPDFIRETLALSPRYCAQLSAGYMDSSMEFVRVLLRLGYIQREPERGEVFDPTLISEIHGPGDHYAETSAYDMITKEA
jgi:NitT/TauT family transport system substrate-binding protein